MKSGKNINMVVIVFVILVLGTISLWNINNREQNTNRRRINEIKYANVEKISFEPIGPINGTPRIVVTNVSDIQTIISAYNSIHEINKRNEGTSYTLKMTIKLKCGKKVVIMDIPGTNKFMLSTEDKEYIVTSSRLMGIFSLYREKIGWK